MSVTEAPQATASTAAAEQPADTVRLTQLEAQVQDLDRRVEGYRLVHDSWTLVIFAVAVAALLAGIIAVGFGMRAIDEAERQVEASLAPLAGLFAVS